MAGSSFYDQIAANRRNSFLLAAFIVALLALLGFLIGYALFGTPGGGVATLIGATALALRQADGDQEVFRTEHSPEATVRTAFTADGRFLLVNWVAGPHSRVDLWEL